MSKIMIEREDESWKDIKRLVKKHGTIEIYETLTGFDDDLELDNHLILLFEDE